MDLRKDCVLQEVVYKNDDKKVVLTFLDLEQGQVLEVNFNKQSYNNGKFVDDPEKAAKVDEWCKQYFDTTFESLSQKKGEKRNIYVYENFNSLWESQETKKFTKDMNKKIFTTEISRVVDDGRGIHIYFDIDGDEYESKMMYADYIDSLKQWFNNPQKEKKQRDAFKEKFGVDVENAEEIVGKEIMVEGKVAFGKFPYAEIKDPIWN